MIGTTIEWATNPLASVVRLDEAGRRILWLALKLEVVENHIVGASVELEAANKPLEDRVKSAIEELNVEYVLGDTERYGKTIDQYIDVQLDHAVNALVGSHDGDCTCVPCSCLKCHTEHLLGIDTIGGLGQHAAAKIKGAFTVRATLDEAVAYLRDYKPVYKPTPAWPEEEWAKHVPRWLEEGKRAHDWLVKYREERMK